ncbi:hypothetical protein PHAVU_010G019350 [Phaseolus vulgaris]
MTRGNQRDRDRERAQARAAGKSKHLKNDGFTPQQRRKGMQKHCRRRRRRKLFRLQEGIMQVAAEAKYR